MTRKDFEEMAEAMYQAMPDGYYDPAMDDNEDVQAACRQFDKAVSALASCCAKMNPRFDRERFVADCHGE